MTSSKTTTPQSLEEQVKARIAELRKQAEQCEPDSGKWFRLHKTADELEQVLSMINETAKELEATRDEYKKVMDGIDPKTAPMIDQLQHAACVGGCRMANDALALLIKKEEQ